MAKLTECAAGYRDAAVRLRLAIADRQQRARQGDREAQRQVALLRQMLQQMRDLRELAEGYYTRPRSGAYTTAGLKAPRRDPLK